MALRYLFGPVTPAFADQNLDLLRATGACRSFGYAAGRALREVLALDPHHDEARNNLDLLLRIREQTVAEHLFTAGTINAGGASAVAALLTNGQENTAVPPAKKRDAQGKVAGDTPPDRAGPAAGER